LSTLAAISLVVWLVTVFALVCYSVQLGLQAKLALLEHTHQIAELKAARAAAAFSPFEDKEAGTERALNKLNALLSGFETPEDYEQYESMSALKQGPII
jgi:hypothetical protein